MGKYFTISELCKSDKAKKLKIDNTPSQEIKDNITMLIDKLLDPIRELVGKPISVSSGYRSKRLNKVVGGSSTSAHLQGLAADLNVSGNDIVIYETLVKSGIPFDQVIVEKGTKSNPQWVHVSIRKNGKNRGDKLYYNGKTYERM